MASTESEEQTKESETGQKEEEKDYELLPEEYTQYDLSFKIILIGNSGKKKIIIK